MHGNVTYRELAYDVTADQVRKLRAGSARYPELVHALAAERAGVAEQARRARRGRGGAETGRGPSGVPRWRALPRLRSAGLRARGLRGVTGGNR